MVWKFDLDKGFDVLTFVLPAVTVLNAAVCIFSLVQSIGIENDYTGRTIGNITAFNYVQSSGTTYKSMVTQYMVGKDTLEIETNVNDDDLNVGDNVELIYDPKLPFLAVPNTFMDIYGAAIAFGIFSLLSFVGSVLLYKRYKGLNK